MGREDPLPLSAYSRQDSSFVDLSDARFLEDAIHRYYRLLVLEEELLQASAINFKGNPLEFLKSLRKRDNVPSEEEAQAIATIEAVTLLFTYPQLLYSTPGFAGLYRLLRVLELTQGLKRDQTLLVGSGETLTEASSVLVQPPTEEQVFYAYRASETRSIGEKVVAMTRNVITGIYPAKPQIRDKRVVAIEPNEEDLALVYSASNFFYFPRETLMTHLTTIGGGLKSGIVPSNLDLIIWNRAEPSIVYGKGTQNKRKSNEEISRFLRPITERLSRKGIFVLTVGSGSGNVEFRSREKLIDDASKSFPRLTTNVLAQYSGMYRGTKYDNHKRYYGSIDFGSIGSIVAVKR